MRFGYRQFEPSTKCGDCGQFVDRLGNHCLHCGKYGGWTKRHNLLRDRLFWWCQQGLLLAEREKKGLLGDNRKPADLFISSYLNGRDWAFDFVVRSPFRKDIIRHSSLEVLSAAKTPADQKYQTYSGSFETKCWKFQPVAFEATGGMDDPTAMLIRSIAKSVADRWGTRWTFVEQRIRREMSSIVAKGAAHMFLRRKLGCQPC